MKNFVILLMLLFSGLLVAQKGTVLVAGSFSYTSESRAATSESDFSFAPQVGYQLDDNFTFGIIARVGSTKDVIDYGFLQQSQFDPSFQSNVTRISNNFAIGGFARYTQPLSGVFSIFGELSAGILSTKLTSDSRFTQNEKISGFFIGLEPAVFVDLHKGFGLNFSIGGFGYSTTKSDLPNAKSVDVFIISFGKSLGFGFSKNF